MSVRVQANTEQASRPMTTLLTMLLNVLRETDGKGRMKAVRPTLGIPTTRKKKTFLAA
jgi:hypothetical protein